MDYPKCPKRIATGKNSLAISGIWDEFIPAVVRHPNYTQADLILLGEVCRMAAAMGDLWDQSCGKETIVNSRGNQLLNPATKAYLEYLTQVKQLCRQLGIAMKDSLALERGSLSKQIMQQKIDKEQGGGVETFTMNESEFD